ncbi:MAG: M20/M25/M40 family metallo-hydrolase, partial [Ruminococcaceae bacterium]|nr:M20/M25/M40 family metallo-hydrolase [Oscillospiraceae bacterium]
MPPPLALWFRLACCSPLPWRGFSTRRECFDMWILLTILGAVLLFLAIILLRAAAFRPLPQPKVSQESVDFSQERAVDCLRELIRCKTVSHRDPALEDDSEFEKLIQALPTLYPNVAAACELTRLPDRGLLYRWRGQTDGAPAVMMAHYDVVPATSLDAWEEPPFEGVIRDGRLWGRGALDTKVTFNGILFSADHLIGEGFVPQCDVYFAFSGGEEVNGKGASNIVDYFAEHGIEPSFVLDEGGAVVENVFPGVKQP